MRTAIIFGLFLILLTSFISADILITQDPESFYNLGDVIDMSIKVTSLSEINNFLTMSLICNGIETEVHKEYILLSAGEEKESEIKIPLISSFAGQTSGTCTIKSTIGEEFILTDEFKISNSLTVELIDQTTEVSPGGEIIIEGSAKRATGDNAEGFIEAKIIMNEVERISTLDTINKGYFKLNISIPEDIAAGDYLIKLEGYEKDIEDSVTNTGFTSYSATINQVPTSLEISFEETEIEPGETVKVKAILHDQTGEKISAPARITIKNENDKILEEADITTDEFYKYNIQEGQAPVEWTIQATSKELEGTGFFQIIELEKVDVTVLNKTISIKNIGNVPYNDAVLVKIGEESLNVDVMLDLNKEQKYSITAPDGEYQVEILGESHSLSLTGGAIGIKEVGGISQVVKYPFVWMFVIGVLGFVTYLFFKKGYNKTFVGHITKKKPKKEKPLRKDSLVKSQNPAEVSLSIHGSKQNISLICLKIKNLNNIEKTKGSIEESIQQAVDTAEGAKALTYQNQENLFFLFVPTATKTFKNEKTAIQTAQQIKKILDHHNKLFKDKIDYGISLNYGTIVAKSEEDSTKFMSMGTLITAAKKIATESQGEILLGEKIKEKVGAEVKSELAHDGKNPSYKVKSIKKHKENDAKFISNFIKRLEGHKD
jgi:hypothetical protein|tara:strand:- start:19475 stop:21451 length:1977 start_codon:yes stop_codon:yes gene_type:complete